MELATHMKVSLEKLRQVDMTSEVSTISMDTVVKRKKTTSGAEFTLEALLPDMRAQPGSQVETWSMEADLDRVLDAHLTEREIKVVRQRFGLGDGQTRTLEEIGKGLSVTRERVRQIEVR